MVTLRIEHPVTDFNTWHAAFDRFDSARADGGVLAARIYRPTGDDHYVLLDLDFATLNQAEAFQQFLRVRVWATPENAPALAGPAVTQILQREPPSSAASASATPSPRP